jgi:hypothetical protein
MFFAACAAQNTNIRFHINAAAGGESILRKTRKRVAARIAAKAYGSAMKAAEVFRAYPAKLRGRLLALRRLILKTAKNTEGVGALEETLKWGQPSYLTSETKSGSTIRIDRVKAIPDKYAVYFHCQTGLVPAFRELYPAAFEYEGNRAIVLDANERFDEEALTHCIALALTYHARKKPSRNRRK